MYREDIDNIVGVARVRDLLPELVRGELTQTLLLERIREPYFVPEGTPLNKQLLNFQQHRAAFAFVVDEYGDIRADHDARHLHEIVGELDNEAAESNLGVTKESDRSYVVDASANVRQLNRVMNWNLPTDGPKTLNGLIVEQLATIPETGTGVTVADYRSRSSTRASTASRRYAVYAPGSRPRRRSPLSAGCEACSPLGALPSQSRARPSGDRPARRRCRARGAARSPAARARA